jgi:peptide-methionine (S)-S-oxide reductase
MIRFIITVFIALTVTGCNSSTTQENTIFPTKRSAIQQSLDQQKKLKKAYFAAGCFWCVEAIFESVNGVEEAISGYAGGTTKNPTYTQVSYGRTDHAEAVEVFYDPSVVSFETLVKVFYGSHDPTTLNRQGPDRGSQYRSVAFYTNADEKKAIEKITKNLNKTVYNNKIITKIQKLDVFYIAEDYHQDYEKLNPNQSYVQAVSKPRLNKFKAKFPELLKKGH